MRPLVPAGMDSDYTDAQRLTLIGKSGFLDEKIVNSPYLINIVFKVY
jgi:hypothetical protein